MTNRTFTLLLASAAIVGTTMTGCSTLGLGRPNLASADKAESQAERIERYLGDKDYARAFLLAEALVAARPQDGDARALLGRAYLANGRYVSARTAFEDAMTLGNRDPRTIVSLALAQTGLGEGAAAHDLLTAHIQDIPAGDYGLAMAMTGDPQEAVRALLQAVKQPEATAKTRQNLAYALAMSGAWAQARLVASQDLPAREAEKRMGQWGWSFLEDKASDRVVAMIGIAPRADDEGLPAALALDLTPAAGEQPVELASADALVDQAHADLAQADLAEQAHPVESAVALVDLPGQAPAPADSVKVAFAGPAPAQPDSLHAAMQAAFGSKLSGNGSTSRTARGALGQGIAAPAADGEASDWVIQLGAFDSEAVVNEKWRRIAARSAGLNAFKPVNSVFTQSGRTYHRLAIRGFGTRGAADATCAALRGIGQDCFVRLDDTGATKLARVQARKGEPQVAKAQTGDKGVSLATR
jgi:Flp pilus assembly protein TadD/cell division septation protein DedD